MVVSVNKNTHTQRRRLFIGSLPVTPGFTRSSCERSGVSLFPPMLPEIFRVCQRPPRGLAVCGQRDDTIGNQRKERTMAGLYDIVIRGGTIMDGNGGTPFTGDVAVKDGRIAAVGTVDGRGEQ